MNKKLIAAALGLAFAGVAQAQSQSNVVLYGIVDGGLRFDRTQAGTLSSVVGGGASGSRLGVRGTEDLGSGMKANFVLEQGVDISDNSVPQGDVGSGNTATTPRTSTGGRFFSRVATVGLSGVFGNLRFGRDYSPYYNAWSAADPFGAGTVGTLTNISAGNITRFDNGIFYDLPSELIGGIKGSLALRLGESSTSNSAAVAVPAGTGATGTCTVTGVPTATTCATAAPGTVAGVNKNGGNAISLSLGYANGPVYAAYGFNNVKGSLDNGRTRSHTLAATYDFGVVKAHGLWWSSKDNIPTAPPAVQSDTRSWALGLSAPFAGANLMAAYGRLDDRSANDFDARFASFGGTYSITRRTDFYGAVSRMTNRNGAHYLISDASNAGLQTSVGASSAVPVAPALFTGNVGAGYSPTALQVGVRHRF